MIKVDYWAKGSREKSTEVVEYEAVLAVVTGANHISVFDVEDYIDNLKELMEDDEECGLEYLVEKLEKFNPKTKVCRIDTGNGEPSEFIVPNFEDKKIKYNDDFYIALLSSKAFWDWFRFHYITINDKSIEPVDNGVERLD